MFEFVEEWTEKERKKKKKKTYILHSLATPNEKFFFSLSFFISFCVCVQMFVCEKDKQNETESQKGRKGGSKKVK